MAEISAPGTGSEDLFGVPAHYARTGLVAAIRNGIGKLGKSTTELTLDDLAGVDEFHIGGRVATEALLQQLQLTAEDHVLDIGCGLGGAARYAAARYGCRVTGIDLTTDYVEAGQELCRWVNLDDRVSLHQASALSIPFAERTFTAAWMLHVGMNVRDKERLFSEARRVLRSGSITGVYDVMRIADGELAYPLPWATVQDANAIATPDQYRTALQSAGFEILAERSRQEFALSYFAAQQSKAFGAADALGLDLLMGSRRQQQVRNMIQHLSRGVIAPFEMIARII